jgi:endonuclease/exonuclease/phosphatase family metal-dependent hydrolase
MINIKSAAQKTSLIISIFILPILAFSQNTTATLRVMSWNVKHLGRKNFDPRISAPLLKDEDLIVFQEVNTSSSGTKALSILSKTLSKLVQEKICMAFSETPQGEKERFGFLWRNSAISYITVDGKIVEDCADQAYTIRLGVKHAQEIAREPAVALLWSKKLQSNFNLIAVHLRPSDKKPQQEIPPLVDTLKEISGPMILLGDFNMKATHQAFNQLRSELKLNSVFEEEKTSLQKDERLLSKAYDNIWVRGFVEIQKMVSNLFDYFPDLSPQDIYRNLSDHCPISATLVPEKNSTL